MKEILTSNDKAFILNSLLSNSLRVDGRKPFDYRNLTISFGGQYGTVEVRLGDTKVITNVSAKIVAPRPERPTEGFFQFYTEFSPMSSVDVEVGRASLYQVEVGRIVERGLRESRAIDTESLCIVAGEKVWQIRCSIHVIDNCGNLIDSCSIAAITALLHFRRPDVTIIGEEVTVHTIESKPPVPLSIHHTPICVTFAIFDDGNLLINDPTVKEELAMDGRVTIIVNSNAEICGIQKSGGVAISLENIVECTKIAAVKSKEICDIIKETLAKNDSASSGSIVNKPISSNQRIG